MPTNTKTKSKKEKKEENQTPQKTEFEIVYEQYVDPQLLTAAQQKRIVAAFGLSNHCLYDSLIIDLLTECLRFCKRVQFDAFQARYVYVTMQYLLFNCSENSFYDQAKFQHDLKMKLEFKLAPVDSTVDATNQCVSFSQCDIDAVYNFVEQRILSKFTLYRTALYEQNPANIQYTAFKKQFEIGNVIQLGSDAQYLFQLQEFCQHYVIAKHIKSEDAAESELCDGDHSYFISKDQLPFVSFISESIEQNEAQKEKENIDIESGEQPTPLHTNETDEHVDQEKTQLMKVESDCGAQDHAISEKQDSKSSKPKPKTLIDIIVQEKVQQELRKCKQ
mmetsp:Transcript_51715/g.85664  ORF Transcript_51715/g.85664 Transcript_51715/m.85664 type:complete len:333 (+) Transcript_51715:20-1018(+)